jgi:hypothetical protein
MDPQPQPQPKLQQNLQTEKPTVPVQANNRKILVAMAVALVVLAVMVIVLLAVLASRPATPQTTTTPPPTATDTPLPTPPTTPPSAENTVLWQLTGEGWKPMGTPPACPDPLGLAVPIKLADATSVLYPGQTRGSYKPHGGFRFDNAQGNKAEVVAPLDAVIVNGGRYLVGGEIQYTFDFINSCGMMYRLGHLRELTPKLQALADKFPAAQEGDSRTTFVNPPVAIAKGEVLATKVGITSENNTFVDFGVYDLRKKNEASQNAAWAAQHKTDLEQHAVCWFDLLSPADEATVRNLPAADPKAGKTSDYCK